MKKLLNIFLAIAIFTTYSTAGIMSEATRVMTPASSVDIKDSDGNVISTAYYSGGGSITFDFLAPPPPLLTFSTPSIEAGCNGIDFKGFFYNLLGIDQLGETISNAGASLAYGVAVGLIYSLPGVAKAFGYIRKWANKIQQLLANACQSGIAIGMNLGKTAGTSLGELENTVNDAVAAVDKQLTEFWQKGESGIMDVFGMSDSATSSIAEMQMTEKSAAIISFFKSALQSDTSMLGIMLTDIAAKSKVGGAVFEDLFVIKNPDKAITVVNAYIGAVSNGLDKTNKNYTVGIDDIADAAVGGLTGKDQTRLNLFSYVLIYNYIGDIGTSFPDEEKYRNLFDIANAENTGSSATPDSKAETAGQFKEMQKDSFIQTSIVGPSAGILSAEAAGRNLAEFIWIGTKSAASREADNPNRLPSTASKNRIILNGNLRAPKVSVYTVNLENSAVKAYIPVLSNVKSSKKLFYDGATKDFTGVLDQSTCIVEKLIEGNGTVTGCGTVTFVPPEVHKYVKVIKNSPDYEKPRLENVLVLSMAANMATALLYSLDNAFSSITSSKSKFISEYQAGTPRNPTGVRKNAKKAAGNFLKLMDKKSKAIREAKKILEKELAAGFALKTVVEDMFVKQAVKNRERGLKALQK